MAVAGSHVYMAGAGMQVVDVVDPRHPWVVGNVHIGFATNVAVSGEWAYATDYDGFRVLPAQCETRMWLAGEAAVPDGLRLGAFPNPASSVATIRLVLPAEDRVRLAIFDASGRLIRIVGDGLLPPGAHEIRWDRRDERNRLVAPGIYVARLSTSSATETARIVVCR